MKFPDDSSGKRYHLKRLNQARKYMVMKKEVADEKSIARMKHKPYTCDFNNVKKGE